MQTDSATDDIPASMSSAVGIRCKTFSMRPISVHACRLRVLLRSMAVQWLHSSAYTRNRYRSTSDQTNTENRTVKKSTQRTNA